MVDHMIHLGAWASARWRAARADWALLPLGLVLGLATAYAIVADWKTAVILLGIELALPVAIILHRSPFLAVLLWLALNQFLLTTEFLLPYRVAFWMFHRALPPATLGIIILSAMLRTSPRRLPRLGLPELAMIGYLVASLLSIVLLGYTKLATTYRLYDRVFIPICLYLIARLSAPGERDLARLAAVAWAVCMAQVLVGTLSWVMPGALPSGWRSQVGERTVGSLINTSTYTSTLLFCGVLMLYAAMRRRPGPLRTLYLLTFAAAFGFTFLSFSRASWIGGVLVLAGLCLPYPLAMLRLGMIATPLLVIVINVGVLSHQFSWASDRLYSEQSTGSALDRLPAYFAAVRMFEVKPLFGWGYENFDRFDRQFQQRVLDLANDNKDHANHNAYLTILAEQGVVGALLYATPPLWLLLRSIRLWRRRRAAGGPPAGALLVLLWLALLNIFVQNNFTPAWVTYSLGLWWLILGLIAGLVSAPAQAGPLRANL
jgi:O-antigen ligase